MEALSRRIEASFPPSDSPPRLSLRAGNALDDYATPPPFDPALDRPTGEYIEAFHFGIHHLDPESWRYYLPILLNYAISEMTSEVSQALDTFFFSLRSPDRDPPRFASLSPEQSATVEAVLEAVGFTEGSRYQEEALEALQEYWGVRE